LINKGLKDGDKRIKRLLGFGERKYFESFFDKNERR
jgi:hypothetical protein